MTAADTAASRGKGGRYHHGDLKAALIDTSVGLIAEDGVRAFSVAEASRRLGVAVSAPYAHFADREELLAAVAVRTYQLFRAELAPELDRFPEPAEQLAAIARAYVRFAGTHRALFSMLFDELPDKRRHPEIEAAERPIDDAFRSAVRALSGKPSSDELATAIEATAHGHAMLLLDGGFGHASDAVERAAESAGRATLALVESRDVLCRPST
jgi:AcrR family transcriptional regulator